MPDPMFGQQVKAYVALRPGRTATEAEIVEYVRERVASYKYPRSVEFRDPLPMNATGKILKRELTVTERMSALDAAFLQAEDEEPGVSLAIASIAVFEGPVPGPASSRRRSPAGCR